MVHKVVGEEGEHAQGREHRHRGAAVLCIARKCPSTREGDVTFSPVREKVTKERTFVRIELPRERRIKGDGQEAATDAHSSGGIMVLSAQM